MSPVLRAFKFSISDFRFSISIVNRQSSIVNLHSLHGITLFELLIASALGLVVILAIGQVDVTRIFLTKEMSGSLGVQAEASLAVAYLARSLQQADRVNLISPSNVQLRYVVCPTTPPDSACFDNAANYRWAQYRHDSATKEIRYVDPASSCTVASRFRDVDSLSIRYRDEAPPPPGGDPPVQDNNILELVVSTTDPQSGNPLTYTSEAVIRAGAYTNLMTGLAPAGVSDPPASCS